MSLIKNFNQIVNNAQNILDSKARETALIVLEAAIDAVNPITLMHNKVKIRDNTLDLDKISLNLNDYKQIIVIGGGKASGRMAEALEEILQDKIECGSINIPRGSAQKYKTKRIKMHEAGHPIPDEGSVNGTRQIMELLDHTDEKTLVICLLSGGGSALLSFPKRGISLEDMKSANNLLLKSGAEIGEINTVRKHISGIKGGQLATKAYPATILTLIISDVVGNSPSSIASGPTVPDPSTYSDAVTVLKKYDVWNDTPAIVRKHLIDGIKGKHPETLKPRNKHFSNVYNIILGSNRVALKAAKVKASELGLNSFILSSFIEGEARHIGSFFAGIAREMAVGQFPVPEPIVLLAGGETTVTVTGKGIGGRSQELVLGAIPRLKGLEGITFASIGTDGVDGISDAAGAIADGLSLKRSIDKGINYSEYLRKNDSNTFFNKLGDTIITGPTGTNVNDITVLVKLKKVLISTHYVHPEASSRLPLS